MPDIKVRVGQQNAIKVVASSFGGSLTAENAANATNVLGGIASVTQIINSGVTTLTGPVRLGSTLDVSGISTFSSLGVSGLATTKDLLVTGIATIAGATISGGAFEQLKVTGVSTLGITSATWLEAEQLSLSGITTFNEDVKFVGNNTNMRWNHDTSDLTLYDSTRLEFGSNKDFEIWHGGSHTFMKNSGGDLRIRGDKILLKRADDTERYLEANVNNEVKLFFNGNEKFTTTLQGVEIGTVAISTVGFVTATDVWVSGAVTASNINISGISTFAGITTVTGHTLFTKQLSVSGLSTYIGVATYKDDVFIDGTLTAGAIDGGTY